MNMRDYVAEERLRDIAKGRYSARKVRDMFYAAVEAGCLETERMVFEYCALMFLQELHFEFGFGRKRLERFLEGFSEKARAFDAGAYDMDDMRNALAQETGVTLKIVWGQKGDDDDTQ